MNVCEFVSHVKSQHREIADEIDRLDPQPNSTLTAGALARHTRRHIDHGDLPEVRRCFGTAVAAWNGQDEKVQNSIAVSYLAKLNFADGEVPRRWAWNQLPAQLQQVAESVGVDLSTTESPPR